MNSARSFYHRSKEGKVGTHAPNRIFKLIDEYQSLMEDTGEESLQIRMLSLSVDCLIDFHEAVFLHLVDNKSDIVFVASVANDCCKLDLEVAQYLNKHSSLLSKAGLDFTEVSLAFRDGGEVAVSCILEALFQGLPFLFDAMFSSDDGQEDAAIENVILSLQECLAACQELLIMPFFKKLLELAAKETVILYLRALYKPAMNICRQFHLREEEIQRITGFIFHLKTCFSHFVDDTFYDVFIDPSTRVLDELLLLITTKPSNLSKVFNKLISEDVHKFAPMSLLTMLRLCLTTRSDIMPTVSESVLKACVQVAVKRQNDIPKKDILRCRADLLHKAFPVLEAPTIDNLGQNLGGQMPFYDFIADDEQRRDRRRRRFAAPTIDSDGDYFETVGVRTLYMDSYNLGHQLDNFRRRERHNNKSNKRKQQALRSIYVEKSGHLQANGRYIYVGHQNGAPCYMKGAWKLSREVLFGSLSWVIGRVPVPYYAVPSGEILPPANKWLCHNDVEFLHGMFAPPRLHSRSRGLRAKIHALHKKHYHGKGKKKNT